MYILHYLDIIIFSVFAINVFYLLFFSIAAFKKQHKTTYSPAEQKWKRFAILIPAYKEDAVIMECVSSCLEQDYPKEKYDIVVISDRMQSETNESLSQLNVKLIPVFFEKSTKSKALNFAMNKIGDEYDIALILDADNTILPNLLKQINNAFASSNIRIVQAHRIAKNLNTNMALLDAVSEEINNRIFRQGHAALGLSSALIGSGMAFQYNLFKQSMLSINAIGGFDRALELTLLKNREKIYYLHDSLIMDEKIQYRDDFSRQRRRWLSAQLHYGREFAPDLIPAIKTKNWDFCDKLFQQISIPRIMLLGFTFLLSLFISLFSIELAYKWWGLFFSVVFALILAIPYYLYSTRLFIAMLGLPYTFLLMLQNVFQLKGANKNFIHTTHGIKNKTK